MEKKEEIHSVEFHKVHFFTLITWRGSQCCLRLYKRGFDPAFKFGKFATENESMTPVLGRNTASCGTKLVRIAQNFSEILLSTNLYKK